MSERRVILPGDIARGLHYRNPFLLAWAETERLVLLALLNHLRDAEINPRTTYLTGLVLLKLRGLWDNHLLPQREAERADMPLDPERAPPRPVVIQNNELAELTRRAEERAAAERLINASPEQLHEVSRFLAGKTGLSPEEARRRLLDNNP